MVVFILNLNFKRNKKTNFKDIKGAVSRDEVRQIKGGSGSGGYSGCNGVVSDVYCCDNGNTGKCNALHDAGCSSVVAIGDKQQCG